MEDTWAGDADQGTTVASTAPEVVTRRAWVVLEGVVVDEEGTEEGGEDREEARGRREVMLITITRTSSRQQLVRRRQHQQQKHPTKPPSKTTSLSVLNHPKSRDAFAFSCGCYDQNDWCTQKEFMKSGQGREMVSTGSSLWLFQHTR